MPVKVSTPTAKPEAAKTQLDAVTVKLVNKLAIPLAKKAAALKLAGEALEKSTFSLYHDFRTVVQSNFADHPQQKQAARALAVNILAGVYDVPLAAIHLSGRDQSRWVYPAEYTNKKGKVVPHPSAGEDLPDDATDDDKEIAEHPAVKGAARLYQMASRLIKVAIPHDERADTLIDEVLNDDGTCTVGESQLYQLATGSTREIVPKGSHGGNRNTKTYDEKTVTAEAEKLASKAWNGEDLVPGYKGTLVLEEITEAFTAAIANLQAIHEKADKAQQKAAKKAGKGAVAAEDEKD